MPILWGHAGWGQIPAHQSSTSSVAATTSQISSSAMAASFQRRAPQIPGSRFQALAARTADYLVSQGERIFTSNERDMTTSPMRGELAPPEAWGKSVPRLT